MASKGKVKSTSYKKGQCGNPNGRPKIPPELKAARKNLGAFLQSGVGEIMTNFYSMSREEFELWANDRKKTGTMLECHLASCLIKAVKSGDTAMINWLMDRYLGKPKQSVDLAGQVNTGSRFTNEQLTAMAREFVKRDGSK